MQTHEARNHRSTEPVRAVLVLCFCVSVLLCCVAAARTPPRSERHHARRSQLAQQPRSARRQRRSVAERSSAGLRQPARARRSAAGRRRPGASWEQADPLTYVVHLRQGVRFHDGHELTADDVVYTFGCFLDPAFVSPRKGAYRTLDRVEAVDPYTVRFIAEGAVRLVSDSAGDAGRAGRRRAGAARSPVGTGPYRFVSFAVDDHVELAAFPDYFGGAPRTPASC